MEICYGHTSKNEPQKSEVLKRELERGFLGQTFKDPLRNFGGMRVFRIS
jgi:hypothetical protein